MNGKLERNPQDNVNAIEYHVGLIAKVPNRLVHMTTRARLVIALAIICGAVCYGPSVDCQTFTQKKAANGSVSGRITVRGKGLAGVTVTASSQPFLMQVMPLKTVTDQEGNYRLAKLPPGTYQISPIAPLYVLTDAMTAGLRGKSLLLGEGEEVQNIDFSLERGGVITGKVTDPEGRPAIEERIMLSAESQNKTIDSQGIYGSGRFQTDDRGVYRIYGVPPGRYRVSAGQNDDENYAVVRPGRLIYRRSYYPDVPDAAKAKIVEVSASGEASGIDITLGRSLPTFSASGIVINGETSQPVSGLRFTLQRLSSENGRPVMPMMSASNSKGEFKIDNIAPGKYSVFIAPLAASEVRTDAMSFEVIDQDVTGLLVKTIKGATVTGVIVIEGDKTAMSKLGEVRLQTYVRGDEGEGMGGQEAVVAPDGTFRVGGLGGGTLNFFVTNQDRRPSLNMTILRVERDGVVQPRGIEIKSGEQLNGIRLVLNYGTGSIRGQVKLENGVLPVGGRIAVWIKKVGETEPTLRPSNVDVRGHFLIEGISAGTYELNVSVNLNNGRRVPNVKQIVNVADGAATDVEVSVDVQPTPNP
jgi:hypothetical protein